MPRHTRVKAYGRIPIEGIVKIQTNDLSQCLSAGCPHYEVAGNSPLHLPCPHGHRIKTYPSEREFNQFLYVGIDAITAQMAAGSTPPPPAPISLAITQVSTGTGDTPNASMPDPFEHLEEEFYRNAPTGIQRFGLVGSYYTLVQINFYYGVHDANANLQEFGLEAGGATSTPGSGITIARVVHPYGVKDSSLTISGQWTSQFFNS